MSEPRNIANEIIEDVNDRIAELHPLDALMVLSYVKEHLTAHVQCVLADVYIGKLKGRNDDEEVQL